MREALRWIGSFAFVLALHAAAIRLALGWVNGEVPYSPPPAAIMMELAPLPAAPEAVPNEAPPGPELSEVIPEPEEPPPVEMPPPVLAEVTLPDPEPPPPLDLKPPPPPKPPEKKVERKPPQPRVSAPQAAPEPARTAAAPMPGASVEPPSATLPTWKGLLFGICSVTSAIPSRRSAPVSRASPMCASSWAGTAACCRRASNSRPARPCSTREAMEWLQRAQPLPALPMDQPGESIEIIVPFQFKM